MHPLIGEADSHAGAQFLKNNDPPDAIVRGRMVMPGGSLFFKKGFALLLFPPPSGGLLFFTVK